LIQFFVAVPDADQVAQFFISAAGLGMDIAAGFS